VCVRDVLADAKRIQANQTTILGNQTKRDQVLANQQGITASPVRILAHQKTLLAR
jgi:hypothetical protein